jgi:haloalkane dehalogenase
MKPEMRKLYQHPYDSWKNRIATLRFVQDIPLTETDRNYALISEVEKSLNKFNEMPVLICWGELDFVFDQHFLAEWKRRFSNAEIHNFPDCGHYILEDAGEYIIPLIKNFLTDRFTNEES